MITIVDYNGGNLRSVKRACDAVGIASEFTQDPDAVRRAERIIFPGVGAAASAMATVNERGLGDALREARAHGVPILGICIGAQIILETSEEDDTKCLGLIDGKTVRFRPQDPALKVPHIGWNEVRVQKPHPVLAGIEPGDEFYFVHSYFPNPKDPARIYATAEYGGDFCCALGQDNLFATQFHPEKSGPLGLALLERFSRWDGTC
jgi:glutamine amidotransferase